MTTRPCGRAFVRPGGDEAARPMIPVARFVRIAPLRQRRELAERHGQVGAGLRRHRHGLGRFQTLLRGLHPALVVGGRNHAGEHVGRLDHQHHARAGGEDFELLRRVQQAHQVEHHVDLLQGLDHDAVTGQRRDADIGALAERAAGVARRHVDAADLGAQRHGGAHRHVDVLRQAVFAGQHRNVLAGLDPAQSQHLAPHGEFLIVADRHGCASWYSGFEGRWSMP